MKIVEGETWWIFDDIKELFLCFRYDYDIMIMLCFFKKRAIF